LNYGELGGIVALIFAPLPVSVSSRIIPFHRPSDTQ